MDILIAILFYLQLLVPGQTYTTNEINAIYESNQSAVESIQNDEQQTNQALNYFDESNTDLIEIWEDPIEIPEPQHR